MPIKNGREIYRNIIVKPGQPEAIQRKINPIEQLKSDLKSDIVTTDKEGYELDPTFGPGFNIFDKDDEASRERKTRYQYFKEMDTMEFIHRGLEIVADDSTQINKDGNVIELYSEDEDTKSKLNELFFDRIDVNNELWSIVYETCKMGDNFYEIIVDDYKNPKKIIHLRYLDPGRVNRVEKDGKLSHFTYKTEKYAEAGKVKVEETIYKLMPWQIIHFKLENKEFYPYGGGLLNAGIKTYRRLSLLEDIMLVYRISRAPERRVFYIDIGNLNKIEAKRFLEKIKNSYRSQSFIDETGNINKRAHIMSTTSDIFVPVREGQQGTRIESLRGGEALHNIDDMKYFKDKILRTMNIPPAYLGDEADRSRGALSQLDIKFSRFIERIQSEIVQGLNKIAALELFFNGAKKEDLNNFSIELTPPSNIKEITEIDFMNQKMGLLSTIQGLNIFSNEWMLRSILRLSDREISDIMMYKKLEGKETGEAGAAGFGAGGALPALPAGGELGAQGTATPEVGAEGGGGAAAGAEGGGETPSAAEAPATPTGELAASTIVKALGREFLVERQEDFFKLMRLMKDEKNWRKGRPMMLKEIAELFASRKNEPKLKNQNVEHQTIINELGGLKYLNGNGERTVKLYESYKGKKTVKIKGKKKTESVIKFRTKEILLSE